MALSLGNKIMKKILILGAKGMLGQELMKIFGSEAVGWDREDLDVLDFSHLRKKIIALNPSAIINCVAYNNVDGAESNFELAKILNSDLVRELAEISAKLQVPIVHFSSNYVFTGGQGDFAESDLPDPKSAYAKSKYLGELELQKYSSQFYLIRTSVLFGKKGGSELSKKSFIDLMLEKSAQTDSISLVTDEVNSLTFVSDLAAIVKLVLVQRLPFGIYHAVNSGSASWYDFGKEIFSLLGKRVNLIAISSNSLKRQAIRPKKSILINTKLPQARSWQEALKIFLVG